MECKTNPIAHCVDKTESRSKLPSVKLSVTYSDHFLIQNLEIACLQDTQKV